MNDTRKDGLCPALHFLSEDVSENDWPAPADFDPGWMLDLLIANLQLPDDEALAQRLQVTAAIVKMIREEKLAISPSLMLRWVHTNTGIALADLREMANSKRRGA